MTSLDPEEFNATWQRLFGQAPPMLDQLLHTDPAYLPAKLVETAVTQSVDALRRGLLCPCPPVQSLMQLTYRLIHYQVLPAGTTPEAVTPRFGLIGAPGVSLSSGREKMAPALLFPLHWAVDLLRAPTHELCALIFVSSHARDWYNGRYLNELDPARERARAYEAEWVRALAQVRPLKAGEIEGYVKESWEKYPEGLASLPPEWVYQSRPFVRPGKPPR